MKPSITVDWANPTKAEKQEATFSVVFTKEDGSKQTFPAYTRRKIRKLAVDNHIEVEGLEPVKRKKVEFKEEEAKKPKFKLEEEEEPKKPKKKKKIAPIVPSEFVKDASPAELAIQIRNISEKLKRGDSIELKDWVEAIVKNYPMIIELDSALLKNSGNTFTTALLDVFAVMLSNAVVDDK